MAYNNRFVVTIIKDRQILKELANGSVPIEFGSEYKIRLRNKHNRRAVCKLYIDGENVSEGGFIIPANGFLDVERPVNVAKKFKFVSLDSEEAYDFGKNGCNSDKIKGTIVAEFALEEEPKIVWERLYPNYSTYPPYRPFSYSKGQILGECDCLEINAYNSTLKSKSVNNLRTASNTQSLFDGATVEGSHSTQSFRDVVFKNEDNWTTVRLFLQGYNPQQNTEQVCVKNTIVDEGDEEMIALEKELAELKKQKLKKEIEQLKAELA